LFDSDFSPSRDNTARRDRSDLGTTKHIRGGFNGPGQEGGGNPPNSRPACNSGGVAPAGHLPTTGDDGTYPQLDALGLIAGDATAA